MPVITVDIGVIPKEQKTGLIERLTATAVEVAKIPQSAFTIVINELGDDNIGVGGRTLGDAKKAAHR